MNTIQTNYQALVTEENEAPHESVIFQAASEGGKPLWNHIGDLDLFFRYIYEYHQKCGFWCIVLEEIKKVLVPFLIIFGFIYAINGINFNFEGASSPLRNMTDIELGQLFLNPFDAMWNFGPFSWTLTAIGTITIFVKCCKMGQTLYTFWDIQKFYTTAMKIDEPSLSHMTWHEVQCRLREAQHEQQMCVQKSDLTELDISHRILRHTNYLVAMINKNVLPIKINLPRLEEWIFFTSAFEFVLYLVLFSRFSPVFKETGKLSDEFKRYARRKEAAASLEKILNFVFYLSVLLAPVFIMYSLASHFLKYAADIRYAPYRLFTRQWSKYGKYYLRHFNELDHELEARLARAYHPSNDYMKSFTSRFAATLAKMFSRIFGALGVLFLLWGLFVEKLFNVPYVLMIVSACYIVYNALTALIPEENVIYNRKRLMKKIMAEIHYVPDHFKGNAHLPTVRDEFSHLFQFKFVPIVAEVGSALILPYILWYKVYPRALDIVDFFRNFTIEVSGVGDVCSFALMDVSRHGNNQWQSNVYTKADQREQAEGGKTELSLMHFTLMNPHWKPPPASDLFIKDFRERVNTARDEQNGQNPYYASLNSLSTMGSKYASLVNSLHCSQFGVPPEQNHFANADVEEVGPLSGGVSLAEGPPYVAQGGFLSSRQGDFSETHIEATGVMNPLEMRAADMSFGALYLHEVHQQIMVSSASSHPIPHQESGANDNEESPLLEVVTANYVQ